MTAGSRRVVPSRDRLTKSPSWRLRALASCTDTESGLSQVILVMGSGVSCSQLLLAWRPSWVAKPEKSTSSKPLALAAAAFLAAAATEAPLKAGAEPLSDTFTRPSWRACSKEVSEGWLFCQRALR